MAIQQKPIDNEQFNDTMSSRIKNEQLKQKYDKTIKAQIIDATKAKEGKYFVKDENLTQYWVYSSNISYQEGNQVYITIPQGDYSKDKIIIDKKIDTTDSIKTRNNYLSNFIDFTGNIINNYNNTYLVDETVGRWLKNKTTTYLYTSVEVDIAPQISNLCNKDILKFKDSIGAKITITYKDNSEQELFFPISEFLGCLYNTRVLGEDAQYFLQERVFSIKDLKLEDITSFKWEWCFDFEAANVIQVQYKNPQIKIGCNKEEFDGEDKVTLYTLEEFKDNKFYSGESKDHEKQTEVTFFIEWLHLDSKTNTVRKFYPNQDYQILWYKYAKNNLPTKNDKYSTTNWPRTSGQLDTLFDNYKKLFIQLNENFDKIILSGIVTQQDINNFKLSVENTYNNIFKSQFESLINQINTELTLVEKTDILFDNTLIEEYITNYKNLIDIDSEEERFSSRDNLINLYTTKINTYLSLPSNLFAIKLPLFASLGATGAKVVILKCGQPLLKTIYSNEIILLNGDTSGLGRNEYGNPLTIIPSDGSNGIYNLYSLSGSLRDMEQATKIRELNIYYEGKKLTGDEISNIVWDIPQDNTMIKPMQEILYDGITYQNDIYYYNGEEFKKVGNEQITLEDKMKNCQANKLYYKKNNDYIPIDYTEVPNYFKEDSNNKNSKCVKEFTNNNSFGTIVKSGTKFKINATYKIDKFYNESDYQINCLYQIKEMLDRNLSNNYISVGVTFLDGSYCQGGINLRFNNTGTNGSPFNFYLTVDGNKYPVLTVKDGENSDELIINAHLEDIENDMGINLLQDISEPNIKWKLNHGENNSFEFVKIEGLTEKVSTIKLKQATNSSAKTNLILGNRTVLEASIDYGGYHLETFLPIALRSDEKYISLRGTTDLYYNSANGLQFNSESFMPYDLQEKKDNMNISVGEIDYIINPSIKWETVFELPEDEDIQLYFSWNNDVYPLFIKNESNNYEKYDTNWDQLRESFRGNGSYWANFSQYTINELFDDNGVNINNKNNIQNNNIDIYKNFFNNENNGLFGKKLYENNFLECFVPLDGNGKVINYNPCEPDCLIKYDINNSLFKFFIPYYYGSKEEEDQTIYYRFPVKYYYISQSNSKKSFDEIIIGDNYNQLIKKGFIEDINENNILKLKEFYYKNPKNIITNNNYLGIFTTKEITGNFYQLYLGGESSNIIENTPVPTSNAYAPIFQFDYRLQDNILKLDDYYFVDRNNDKNYLNNYCIAVFKDNKVIWSQPIVQIRNLYPSAVVNNWNGKVEINEEQGTVMAPMIVAGNKNANNTFSGVILGAPQGDYDDSMSYTGIYGYGNGVQTYGFRADGTAFIGAANRGQINFDGNESVIQSGNYEATYNEDGNRIVTGTKIDLDDGTIDSKYMTLKDNQMTLGESSLGQIQFNADKSSGTITSNNYTVSNGEKGIKIDLKNGTMILASNMELEFQLPEYINYSKKITDFAFKLGIEIFNLGLKDRPDIGLKYIEIFLDSYRPNTNESNVIGDSGYIDPEDGNILIKSIAQCLNYIIEDIFTNNSKYNELYKILASSENNKFDEGKKILNSYLDDNTDTNNMEKQTIFILSLFNEKIQKGIIGAILGVSLDNIIINSETIKITENDIFTYIDQMPSSTSTVYWLSLCAAACLLYMCKISPYSSDYTLNESKTDFSLNITTNDARMLQRLQMSHGELQLVDDKTEKFQYKTNFSPYGFYTTKIHYKKIVSDGQPDIQEDSKIIFDLLNTPSIMDTLYLNSILSINLNNPSICGTSKPTGEGQYAGQLYFRISE